MDNTISQEEFSQTLDSSLEKICKDGTPLTIERIKGEKVVILTEQDYAGLEETSHLLSTESNATRLKEALNRNPSERTFFESIDELKHEVGI